MRRDDEQRHRDVQPCHSPPVRVDGECKREQGRKRQQNRFTDKAALRPSAAFAAGVGADESPDVVELKIEGDDGQRSHEKGQVGEAPAHPRRKEVAERVERCRRRASQMAHTVQHADEHRGNRHQEDKARMLQIAPMQHPLELSVAVQHQRPKPIKVGE